MRRRLIEWLCDGRGISSILCLTVAPEQSADPPFHFPLITFRTAGPPPSMDDSPFARRMDGLGHACSDRRLRTRQSIPCKLNTIPSMNPLNQPACRITQEGFTHRQAVSGYRWMDSGTVHDGLVGSGVQVGSIMRACKRLGIIHRLVMRLH